MKSNFLNNITNTCDLGSQSLTYNRTDIIVFGAEPVTLTPLSKVGDNTRLYD